MRAIRIIIIIGECIDKALPLLNFIHEKVEERKKEKLQKQIADDIQKQQIINQELNYVKTNENV